MVSKRPSLDKVRDRDEIERLIMMWFGRENKPATATSLTDALGSRIAKAAVQRVLEQLCADGKLQTKVIKKGFYYFLCHTSPSCERDPKRPAEGGCTGDDASNVADDRGPGTEAAASHKERIVLLQQITEKVGLNNLKQREMEQLAQKSTVEERAEALAHARQEVKDLQEKVAVHEELAQTLLATKGMVNCVETFSELLSHYHTARRLWKERKEFAQRLIDGVLGESYNEKDLEEMIGYSSDREAGVSFQTSALLLPLESLLRH